MADSLLSRVPVVAGLAYVERSRHLPAAFPTSLAVEDDNRYFPHAIAVLAEGHKIGYIAPEVAATVFGRVQAADTPLNCPARRAAASDHETSGVEFLLDCSALFT